MKVPSRHSPTHTMRLSRWLGRTARHTYHLLPDAFASPLESQASFLFVCGCGHTGTTLAAAKLGNHDEVLLIGRETGMFSIANPLLCARNALREWDYFAGVLGKKAVIEKTPKHVQTVSRITKVVPQARFLVLTRNPLDTIASLYKRLGSLHAATARWIVDHQAVSKLQGRENVLVVPYEVLTAEPEAQFERICRFAELEWNPEILISDQTAYGDFEQKGTMRTRSQQVARPIESRVGTWRGVLSEQQAKGILKKTRHLAVACGYSGAELSVYTQ